MRVQQIEVRPKQLLRGGSWVVDVSVVVDVSEPDTAVAMVCGALRGQGQGQKKEEGQ